MLRELFLSRLPPIAEWDIRQVATEPTDDDGFREVTIRFRYRDTTRPITQSEAQAALEDLWRTVGDPTPAVAPPADPTEETE
jgi:hypothetical protein